MELENDETISKLLEQFKAHGAFNEIFERCTNDIYSEQIFLKWKQQIEYNVTKYLNRYQFSSELDKNNMQEIIETYLICGPQTKSFENGADRIVRGMASKMVQYFEPKISFVIEQFLSEKNKHTPIDQNGSSESIKKSNNKKDETITVFHTDTGLTSVTKNMTCIKNTENIEQAKAIQLCIEPKSLDNQYNNKIKVLEAPKQESLLMHNDTKSIVCKIDINPHFVKMCEDLKHKFITDSKNTTEPINKFKLNLDEKRVKSFHDRVNLNSEVKADMNINKTELNYDGSLKSQSLELKCNTGEINKGKKKTKQKNHKLCVNNIIETTNMMCEDNIQKTCETNTRIYEPEKTLSSLVSCKEIENKCAQALGNVLNKLLDGNQQSEFSGKFNKVLDDLFDENINNHNEIDKFNDLLSNNSNEKNHNNQVKLNLDQKVFKSFNNEINSTSEVKADIKLNKTEFDLSEELKSTAGKIKKGKRQSNYQNTTSKQKINKLCEDNFIYTAPTIMMCEQNLQKMNCEANTKLNEYDETLSGTVLYKEIENNCSQTLSNPMNDNLQTKFSKSKAFPSKFPEVLNNLFKTTISNHKEIDKLEDLISNKSIEEAENLLKNINHVSFNLDEKEVKSFTNKVNLNIEVEAGLSLNNTEFDLNGELNSTTLKLNTGRIKKGKRKSKCLNNTSKQKNIELCEDNLLCTAPTIMMCQQNLQNTYCESNSEINKSEEPKLSEPVLKNENEKNFTQTLGNLLSNPPTDYPQAECSKSNAFPSKFNVVLDDLFISDNSIEEAENLQHINQVDLYVDKKENNLNSGFRTDLSLNSTEFNSNADLINPTINMELKTSRITRSKKRRGRPSYKSKQKVNKLRVTNIIDTEPTHIISDQNLQEYHCESITDQNEPQETTSGTVLYKEIENNFTQTLGNILSNPPNDNLQAECSKSNAFPSKFNVVLDDMLISDKSIKEAENLQCINQVDLFVDKKEDNLNSGVRTDLSLNSTEFNCNADLINQRIKLKLKTSQITKGKKRKGRPSHKSKQKKIKLCDENLIYTVPTNIISEQNLQEYHCESITNKNEPQETTSGTVLYENTDNNCTQTSGNDLSTPPYEYPQAGCSKSNAFARELIVVLDEYFSSANFIKEAKNLQCINQVDFNVDKKDDNVNFGVKTDMSLNSTEFNCNADLLSPTINMELKTSRITRGKKRKGRPSYKSKQKVSKLCETNIIDTAPTNIISEQNLQEYHCESITDQNEPQETTSGTVLYKEIENNFTQTLGNILSNPPNDNLQAECSKSNAFPSKFNVVLDDMLISDKSIKEAENLQCINQVDLFVDKKDDNVNLGVRTDLSLNSTEFNCNADLINQPIKLKLKTSRITKGKKRRGRPSHKSKQKKIKSCDDNLIYTVPTNIISEQNLQEDHCESITEPNETEETIKILNTNVKFTDFISNKSVEEDKNPFEHINQVNLNLGNTAELKLNNTEFDCNGVLKSQAFKSKLNMDGVDVVRRKSSRQINKAKQKINKLCEYNIKDTAQCIPLNKEPQEGPSNSRACPCINKETDKQIVDLTSEETVQNEPQESTSGTVLYKEIENNFTQTLGNILSNPPNDNLQAECSKSNAFPSKFNVVLDDMLISDKSIKEAENLQCINQVDLFVDKKEDNLNSGVRTDLSLNSTEFNCNADLINQPIKLKLKTSRITKGKKRRGRPSHKSKQKKIKSCDDNLIYTVPTNIISEQNLQEYHCESITNQNEPQETTSGTVLYKEIENNFTQTLGNILSNPPIDNLQAECSKSNAFPSKFNVVLDDMLISDKSIKGAENLQCINQVDLFVDKKEDNLNSGVRTDLSLNSTEFNCNADLINQPIKLILKTSRITKGKKRKGRPSHKSKQTVNNLCETNIIHTAPTNIIGEQSSQEDHCESITEQNESEATINILNTNDKFTDFISNKSIEEDENTFEQINQVNLNLGVTAELKLNKTEFDCNGGLKSQALKSKLNTDGVDVVRRKSSRQINKAKEKINKLFEDNIKDTAQSIPLNKEPQAGPSNSRACPCTNKETDKQIVDLMSDETVQNEPQETTSGTVLYKEIENNFTQTLGNILSNPPNDNLQEECSKSNAFPSKFNVVLDDMLISDKSIKEAENLQCINHVDLFVDKKEDNLNSGVRTDLSLNNTEFNCSADLINQPIKLKLKTSRITKGKKRKGRPSHKSKQKKIKSCDDNLIYTVPTSIISEQNLQEYHCESITNQNEPQETTSGTVLYKNINNNCTQTSGNVLSVPPYEYQQAGCSKSNAFRRELIVVLDDYFSSPNFIKEAVNLKCINQVDFNVSTLNQSSFLSKKDHKKIIEKLFLSKKDDNVNLGVKTDMSLNSTEFNCNADLLSPTINMELKTSRITRGKKRRGRPSYKSKQKVNKLCETNIIDTAPTNIISEQNLQEYHCESITDQNEPQETTSGTVLYKEIENNFTQTLGNILSNPPNDNLQAECSKSNAFPSKFNVVLDDMLISDKSIKEAENLQCINQVDLFVDKKEDNLNSGVRTDLSLNSTEFNCNADLINQRIKLKLKTSQITKGKKRKGRPSHKSKQKKIKLCDENLIYTVPTNIISEQNLQEYHCESITDQNEPQETTSGTVLYKEIENNFTQTLGNILSNPPNDNLQAECSKSNTFPSKFNVVLDDMLISDKSIKEAENLQCINQVDFNVDKKDDNVNLGVKTDMSLNSTEFNCNADLINPTVKLKLKTSRITRGKKRKGRPSYKSKQKVNNLCETNVIHTAPTNIIGEQSSQEDHCESITEQNESEATINILNTNDKFTDFISNKSVEEDENTFEQINQVNLNLGVTAELKLNKTEFDCNGGLKSQALKSKLNTDGVDVVRRKSIRQINKAKEKINKLFEDNIKDTAQSIPLNKEPQAGSSNSRACPCINKETDKQIVDLMSDETAFTAKLRDGIFAVQGKKCRKVFKGFSKKDVAAKCKQLNNTIQQLKRFLKKLNKTN